MKAFVRSCASILAAAVIIGASCFGQYARGQTFTLREMPADIGGLTPYLQKQAHPLGARQPRTLEKAPTSLPIQQPPDTSGGCAVNTSYPAPIVALASALKCNPDLLFEYVYNNIEFEPLYGSNKGPLGTLLDRRGSDLDQVWLLAALLGASGYVEALALGDYIKLDGGEVASLLGVKNDANAMASLLLRGGFPIADAKANADGTLNYIVIGHFILEIDLNGVKQYFDPSLKWHNLLSGLPSLGTVLGYSRPQFLASSGGAIDGVSISNVN